MDVIFMREPVPHLIFYDIFTKKTNEKIIEEVISLEDKFEPSGTGGIVRPNLKMRSNTVLYLDIIYKKTRRESFFLTTIDRLFMENTDFRDILSSSPFPMSDFVRTSVHETQVSRYGDEGQKYDWHIDSFNNNGRKISFVYYFWKEPKEFTGGDIELTDSPIYDGKETEVLNYKNHLTTIPVNNMAVVFGGAVAHRVSPTTSPKQFDKGRFSANVWIGNR